MSNGIGDYSLTIIN